LGRTFSEMPPFYVDSFENFKVKAKRVSENRFVFLFGRESKLIRR
jgi:hypothetical protein